MEFQVCLFFSTTFLLMILTFKLVFATSRLISNSKKLPPGPWKLPIIGSLHHLASGSLPHHLLRDLSRKYGSIMHLKFGEISTVVISSPRLAMEIMKTRDLIFADRPTLVASEIMFYNKMDIAFAPYGDYWREMRKICVFELLSPKNVKSYSFIREQEVLCMIESIRLSLGSPINLSKKLFTLTSSVVCQAAFGTRPQKQFLAMISEAFLLMGGFDIADLFPSLEILHGLSSTRAKLNFMHLKIDEAFDKIIMERRKKSTHPIVDFNGDQVKDLLDFLLAVQQSRNINIPFTDTNIKAIIFQMFVGGTQTSATTIEWAMSEMLRNPKVMAKAQAEVRQQTEGDKTIDGDTNSPSYLKLVIKETLRLHPPVPLLLPRESRESCQIDGYEIPKRTRVLINAWAIGRDPNAWEDAESFVPERFANSSIDFTGKDFEFIPFGAGRRICPGASFGVAVIELALVQLLYHFNWALPEGITPKNLDMSETSGLTASRKNDLYALATSHNFANGH